MNWESIKTWFETTFYPAPEEVTECETAKEISDLVDEWAGVEDDP